MTDVASRIERTAHLRWVPVAKMVVSAVAQRELNQARVDRIAADLDIEQLGTPVVSARDDLFYVIDGNHRVNALRQHGWGDQYVQCWTYEGLDEEQEAEYFLKLNDTLAIDAMSKFRIGVTAGRLVECDIDRIVRAQNLVVSRDKIEGAIRAVGTLRRIYQRAGARVLRETLVMVRDSYGDPGLEAAVLDGVGLFVQRYEGEIDAKRAVDKWASANGGVNGLTNRAEQLRKQTGGQKGQCVAAAAVEIYNQGRGGKKLTPWWRADDRGGLTAVSA